VPVFLIGTIFEVLVIDAKKAKLNIFLIISTMRMKPAGRYMKYLHTKKLKVMSRSSRVI